MLDEDDCTKRTRPVPDEPQKVRERVVELVCADDGDGDEAREKDVNVERGTGMVWRRTRL